MRWSWREITATTDGDLSLPAGQDGASRPTGEVSIDTRTLSPGDLYVAFVGERLDGHTFVADAFAKGASGAVVSRAVELPGGTPAGALLRVGDTLAALTALGRRARAESTAGVIAVTGSNGKTTTREMIATLLSGDGTVHKPTGNRNNHIGLPLTLTTLTPAHRWSVLELAMNHPGEIATLSGLCRPTAALITNVGRAHVGPVGGIDAVRRAKLEIVDGLAAGGPLLVPADDPALLEAAQAEWSRVVTFGETSDADVRVIDMALGADGCYTVHVDGFPPIRLAGPGRGAALGASAALALAATVGIDPSSAVRRLETWRPFPGRMSVRASRGFRILDDSYNANPDSMAFAVATLMSFPCEGKRVAVLGDMLELGEYAETAHRELGRRLGSMDRVCLVGEQVRYAADEVAMRHPHVALSRWESARELIPELLAFLSPGDVVLVKGSRAIELDCVVDALTRDAEEA